TWLAPEFSQLYDRYLGVQWEERPTDHSIWRRVDNIPNAELWRTHERRRERMVVFARERVRQQMVRRGAPPSEIARAEEVLDPETLTIGFARRFATYKRGTLIFRNLERLTALVNNKDRPVQFVFAGKAHPRDHGGKELIAEINHVCRRTDLTYQDDIESRAIYDLLEQEIVPLFYNRSTDGLPRGWLKVMKRAMSTVCPMFNTSRMVQEYMEKCYAPSAERFGRLSLENLKRAAALAQWRLRLKRAWSQIRIEQVEASGADPMHVGAQLEVNARINLGSLAPDDVEVQLFHGVVDNLGEIPRPATAAMSSNGNQG